MLNACLWVKRTTSDTLQVHGSHPRLIPIREDTRVDRWNRCARQETDSLQ